jgi:muconolactone D-isomerase
MEFLVRIDVRVPDDTTDERIAELVEAERDRGAALRERGTIKRIWRVPGRMRNVGVWEAEDATALHEAITSLPLARWFDVEVTPLAVHPLEARHGVD